MGGMPFLSVYTHYLLPTDADFEHGAAGKSLEEAFDMPREEAAPNPGPYTHAGGGNERKSERAEIPDMRKKPSVAPTCEPLHTCLLGGIGLEPTTSTMSTWRSSQLS